MTKNIVLCFAFSLSLVALTACGQQSSLFGSTSKNSANSQKSQTGQASSATSNQGFSTPIVAPPSFNDRPLEPGQSPQAQKLPNGLPALKPLKGVNVDTLFSQNITNSDDRFDRVENAVVDLRKEFEVMKPAIVRLVAVESDIQELVKQLEVIASEPLPRQQAAPVQRQPLPNAASSAQPATNAPASLTPNDAQTPKASMQAPASTAFTPPSAPKSSSDPAVLAFRDGQHAGKVRLVFDINRSTPYTVDLDSSENFLLIELPNVKWTPNASKTYSSKHPLIGSYNAESINNGAGTRLAIALKRSTSVMDKALLKPSSVSKYHRLYIDLKL